MNCNVTSNGEKIKIDEIKISVTFEREWNRRYCSGENDDWLSELSAGENIGNKRKRGGRYVTLRGLCVDSRLC